MFTARRTFFGFVALLSVFVTAAWERNGTAPHSPHAAIADPEPNPSGLSDVWAAPLLIPGFHSASISSSGAFIATVFSNRNIICVRHQNGRIVWSKPATGVTNAEISDDGKLVIAYAALDTTRASITIFQGAHGETVNTVELNGAVWDVKISDDSRTAIISTGAHTVYLFHLDGKPTYEKWPLDGIGSSVSMSKDGQYVAVGTWDQSGVCLYNTNEAPALTSNKSAPLPKAPKWQIPVLDDKKRRVSNRLCEVQIAHGAQYVLGISYANFRHTNPTVYLWGFDGTSPWKEPMDLGLDASSPTAFITGNGKYVVLSYVSTVNHGDQMLKTKHLIVYNRDGQQVFYLPGFLFSPTLVAASADGSNVVISDGSNKLYTVTIDGRMSSPRVMTSPIQQTISSQDGHFILVYTTDGNLSLMKLG